MFVRLSQRSCSTGEKNCYVERALLFALHALNLAKNKNFQRITRYCNSRIEHLKIILDGLKVSVNEDEEEP